MVLRSSRFPSTRCWIQRVQEPGSGPDPFHADGGFWWGAKLLCDQDSGSVFPVGRTEVTCRVGFDHQLNYSPVDWSTTILDQDDHGSGPFAFDLDGTGPTHRATNPPAGADFDWFAAAAGATGSGWQTDSVDPYSHQATRYQYSTDQVTTASAPMTFHVDVDAAPTLTATASDGVVGRLLDGTATAIGWPLPSITVTGLPEGVTWTSHGPGQDPLTTTGTLAGAPAPGQGGWHNLEVTATNRAGTDTALLRVWIVEPAAHLDHTDPVHPGDPLTVSGTGFTPTGKVQILDHHGTVLDVVDADDHGQVPGTTYRAPQPGRVHFELVDQTTLAVALTPEAHVTAPATEPDPDPGDDDPVEEDPIDDDEPDVDEPDELGQTGPAGLALTALAGALLIAIGTITVLLVRQTRRAPATTPTKETP